MAAGAEAIEKLPGSELLTGKDEGIEDQTRTEAGRCLREETENVIDTAPNGDSLIVAGQSGRYRCGLRS